MTYHIWVQVTACSDAPILLFDEEPAYIAFIRDFLEYHSAGDGNG